MDSGKGNRVFARVGWFGCWSTKKPGWDRVKIKRPWNGAGARETDSDWKGKINRWSVGNKKTKNVHERLQEKSKIERGEESGETTS